MLVENLADLLRFYTDEPDQTVETDANVALWLQLAYDDFRSTVAEIDPTIYTVSHDMSVAGANFLELSGVLLGAAPSQPRLDTLLDITTIQGARETRRWRAGTVIDDVLHGNADYALIGTQLRVPDTTTASIRIYYLPAQNINWTAGLVAGSNVYIDELHRFHDVISLLAYLQYATFDAANHPQLMMLLQRRQEQLRTYLFSRGGPASSEVVDSRWMEP
jgi:hypothetical protein